jgi:uncharacterized RDD family membrane protein YckC
MILVRLMIPKMNNVIDVTDLSQDVLAAKRLRFINYFVDRALQYGLGYLIGLIAGLMYSQLNIAAPYELIANMGRIGEVILGFIILFFYYFIFETTTQRSPAKFITGTKVIMADGTKPSAGAILKRTFCRMIPFDGLSFLGELRNGWHDKIPSTYVVDIKKYDEAVRLKSTFEEIGLEVKE